jgi:hypothetical protein
MSEPPRVAAGDGWAVVPWSQELWKQAGTLVQAKVRKV